MVHRRRLLVAFASGAVLGPLRVRAQEKVRHIGWLEPGTPASFPDRRAAFLDALGKAGYGEGKNLSVDFRFAQGRIEAFPLLAAELVSHKPECVLAVGVDAIRALRRASGSVPIVMGTIDADPVSEGFAASLARPGGNVTGLTGIAWELAGKRLELLLELAPRTKRVGVLFDPRSSAGRAHVRETEAAAKALRIELQLLETKGEADFERAFSAARDGRADALLVVAIGVANAHRGRIVALAEAGRLPAVYSNTEFVSDGGLMGYAPDLTAQFRLAAAYVEKILRGAKAGDLPIQQSRSFELAINRGAAERIGLQIPGTLLARADRVIE